MKILVIILSILISLELQAQVSGAVYYVPTAPGAAAMLDPNLDGYISGSGGFTADVTGGSKDESVESEIDYLPVIDGQLEPTGDLQTGATCGVSEIVDHPSFPGRSAYYYYKDPDGIPDNGDESLLFRMRIADVGSGAYGYSFLLDTDSKIGADDPNSVSGNPGFEIEILYGSGNSGAVKVYLVDGVAATASYTTLASYPNNSSSRFQRSYVSNSNCGGSKDPIFIDFYIDYATILPYISGPIRIAFATSSSASTALGGSASDIGGVDDDAIANDDEGFINAINAFPDANFNFNGNVVLGASNSKLKADCQSSGRTLLSWEAETKGKTTFRIQKSTEGNTWSTVNEVNAESSIGENNYVLIDYNVPENEIIYYRLVTIDQNGITVFSTVVSRMCQSLDDEFSIFPNPARSLINVSNLKSNVEVQKVQIVDGLGRQVYFGDLIEGEINSIEISELNKGMYTIIVSAEEGVNVKKSFIKH